MFKVEYNVRGFVQVWIWLTVSPLQKPKVGFVVQI